MLWSIPTGYLTTFLAVSLMLLNPKGVVPAFPPPSPLPPASHFPGRTGQGASTCFSTCKVCAWTYLLHEVGKLVGNAVHGSAGVARPGFGCTGSLAG